MLITRLITATVLALVFALVIVLSQSQPLWFGVFLSVVSGLTMAEWCRAALKRVSVWSTVVGVLSTLAFIALYIALFTGEVPFVQSLGQSSLAPQAIGRLALFSLLLMLPFFVSFVWMFIIPLLLYTAPTQVERNSIFHLIFAPFAIVCTFVMVAVLMQLKGVLFVVSVLALVWIADSAAYFGGRLIGGPKLAPSISPGKTISGALCGVAGAVVWVAVTMQAPWSFFALLSQHMPTLLVLAIGALLAVLSIVGDLYESLLKRRAGLKDSGRLLPGHGGLWDRLDSIIAICPLVLVLFFLLVIQ